MKPRLAQPGPFIPSGTKPSINVPKVTGRATLQVNKPSTKPPSKQEDFVTPNFGESKNTAVSGNVHIPFAKIEIFARGKSPDVKERFEELKMERTRNQRGFAKDKLKGEELDRLERLDINHGKSIERARALETSGFPNEDAFNNALINHLFEVGKKITPENRVEFSSILNGPNGRSVYVYSTWKLIPEGDKRYLSTIRFTPRDARIKDEPDTRKYYPEE